MIDNTEGRQQYTWKSATGLEAPAVVPTPAAMVPEPVAESETKTAPVSNQNFQQGAEGYAQTDTSGLASSSISKSDVNPPPDVEASFGNPLEKEKVLLQWKSLSRPYKKRGKEFYSTIAAFVFLLTIILAFFKEFLAILAIWAMGFFAYAISATRPEMVEHEITSRGVKTGKNKHRWGELLRFWFEEKWENKILMIETARAFPGRLMLLLGDTKSEEIEKILVRKIAYDKPEKTWVDKASKWLQEKIPLEQGGIMG